MSKPFRALAMCALLAVPAACSQSTYRERTAQVKKTGGAPPQQGPKVLNNLVTELLNVSDQRPSYGFVNPREGWVFIASTADIKGSDKIAFIIDGKPKEIAPIIHESANGKTVEAMRFLPAGEHRLTLSREGKAKLERLIVRAVPETIYCQFQANPHVSEYGPYDWDFLQKHVLHSANTIVGGSGPELRPYIEDWKKQGGRWIVACGVPGLAGEASVTAEEAYQYWSQNAGYQDPLFDGVIADEFVGSPKQKYAAWREALLRLSRNAQFKGKTFYAWCIPLYGAEPRRQFAETLMATGGVLARECYLREYATLDEAAENLDEEFSSDMLISRKVFPGSEKRTVVVLGYMSAPPESLNTNPGVNYKVWMDMQFNAIANHPAFEGLYGVMEYLSSYADEEIVRWTGRLYRHYCIEGRKDVLSKDPYMLRHVQNPDFDDGTNGWTLAPGGEETIATKNMEGFSWLEGRYPPTRQGDNFLWMKRSAAKPNAVSQQIKGLTPGRFYSVKMYTADYQDLAQGKSVRQKHAVSIKVEGVDIVPQKSFQHVFANCYSHHHGPFDDKHKAWMNYHQKVFRAKGRSARLTITDWASDADPGGPPGQELMFNFIEVQPYLPD